MAQSWIPIPIDTKLYLNIDETSLTKGLAALENSYITESGAHSRFPGLSDFVTLSGQGETYIYDQPFRGNGIAVSNGAIYEVSSAGVATAVAGVPLGGGYRPTFTETEDGLLMAAGSDAVLYNGKEAKVLSENAPKCTHVAFIDGYALANDIGSNRIKYSNVGDIFTWNALDQFTASTKPDPVTALHITDFREIMVCGGRSIEQHERLTTGSTPFFRRWSVGEGVKAPYTVLTDIDNATWCVNKDGEFVRASGQSSLPVSGDIQAVLDAIDDTENGTWEGAWTGQINTKGQKFIVLKLPSATNVYGNKGRTLLYDYKQQKWAELYGWDADVGQPNVWPGHSVAMLWGKVLVGGNGKIFKLDQSAFNNGGAVQRMYGRTAHLSGVEMEIVNIRARLKRGVGGTSNPQFLLRACRDNRRWSRWKSKGLGADGNRDIVIEFGGFGQGHTWQFEWMITDDCQVELRSLEMQRDFLGE